uniref:Uncharacterized protein n=1 Tax=Ovis aries TaxID=9940 RepID=A0AC11DBB7_SHEEP
MEDDEEEITAAALRGKPRPLPISALSAFSYVPPRRQDPKEHSYYYRQGWSDTGLHLSGAKSTKQQRDAQVTRPSLHAWKEIKTSQCSWHENLNNVSPLHRFGSLAFFICTGIISLYDCVFKRDPGYNQKLHRDDREHAKSLGLHINEEERERPVGVLSSSVYGRRIHQPVEPLNRDHGRAGHVKADFYRKNDITSIKAPGFGHISPA